MCRCFARVDVNWTLYRGFARASIQVDVTISIHMNKDDMTCQYIVQWRLLVQVIR